MLTEICAEIKNYFAKDSEIYIGDFSVQNGAIVPALTYPTDYIRIAGSHLNDGVHKLSDNDLIDEGTFHGAVWIMSPPKAFLDLADEIAAWQAKYGAVDSVAMSPYTSESFGGYSYSKSSGGYGGLSGTSVPTWQSQFASRLNLYRKIRVR